MRKLSLVVFSVLLSLSMPVWAADSAEQKVLDKLVGTWKTEYKLPVAKWTPTEKAMSATLVYKRVLGGAFVQENGTHSDQKTGMVMYTYDVNRKHYRMWWFSSEGHSSEAMGLWDAEKKKMTWRYSDDQHTTKSHHRFISDDEFEWQVVIRDRAGEVMYQMDGKAIRQKQTPK